MNQRLATHQKLRLTIAIISSFLVAVISTALLFSSKQTHAASKSDWIAGHIISDNEFINTNSMSVSEIQAFLDKKIGRCDTWGTDNNSANAKYAASRGWPGPPYTCLNIYREVPKTTPGGTMPANNYADPNSRPAGSQTAAWIIKDAANRYKINPKVLLVKIATESVGPLTSDNWPLFYQYRYAMGAHCPDSGPNGSANCDPAYAGFSIQIYEAAKLMRSYLDNMDQPWYGYVENGKKTQNPANRCTGSDPGAGVKVPNTTNCILWNVKPRGCGAQNIYIESKATAALYTYTPYQPNAAALNNMYGYGDNCSAYGNRNFWSLYWDWFGNTRGLKLISQLEQRYLALGGTNGSLGTVSDSGYCNSNKTVCWQGFAKGSIVYNKATGAWESKGGIRDRWAKLSYQGGIMGFPTSAEVFDGKGWWQNYQGGAIIGTNSTGFWESRNGGIRDRWAKLKYQSGAMGYPTSAQVNDGKGWWQNYQGGAIVGTNSTGYWESKGGIRGRWSQLGFQTGIMKYPRGPEVFDGKGWWQNYQGGAIIGTNSTGFWESRGATRDRWLHTGAQGGTLGYPTGHVLNTTGGGTTQKYQKGIIAGAAKSAAWDIKGEIRAQWERLGAQGGQAGYPVGAETYNTSTKTWSQKFQKGTISYSQKSGGKFVKN